MWTLLKLLFSFFQTLEEVEKTEGYLMDRVLMQVIFSLAKAGYPQYIEDIKERMRFEKELIPGMSLVTPWYVATQDGEGKHIYLFAAISSITKKLVLLFWTYTENMVLAVSLWIHYATFNYIFWNV